MALALDPGAAEVTSSMVHAFAHVWLARATLAIGDLDAARDLAAGAAVQAGVGGPDPVVAAWANWILVDCERRAGKGEAGVLDDMRRVTEDRGMLPLCAHVLATRAALRSDAGDAAVAHGLALSSRHDRPRGRNSRIEALTKPVHRSAAWHSVAL